MGPSLTEQITITISVVLFEYGPLFSKVPHLSRKGPISANFLARSARQLQAIHLLVEHDHVACGWPLYRSLLERYLLYEHLSAKNEFAVFDDWCFKKHYEFENRLRSSADLNVKPEVRQRDFVQKGKERYMRVSQDPHVCTWRRPDPEASAKSLDLKFLYDAGYDYASGFVHPMSVDGYNDYLRLVARADLVQDKGKTVLVGNSQLIVTMHLQQFLNQPEFNWRQILYDLTDALRDAIHNPQADVMTPLQKVLTLSKEGYGLARPTGKTT
jgi:hypothetical protein